MGVSVRAVLGVAGLLALAAAPLPAAELDEAQLQRLEAAGVPTEPLLAAASALACGLERGELETPVVTLVDFSRPSSQRRLWVLDLERGEVVFHEFVSHGSASGGRSAESFSNAPGSHQSSLGLFRTGETYFGKHGYSLRLEGLEPGINDRALQRGIVIHGADYATAKFANTFGWLGRSWGCPAVDPEVNRELIDTIHGGTAFFAYYPDTRWLESSPFLSCETATVADNRH